MKLKPNDNTIGFKRFFFLKAVYRVANEIINTPFKECIHSNCDNRPLEADNDQIDIVTVAFNNEHVIKLQIHYLKKYIQDKSYTFVVADNSNDEEKQLAIRQLCEQENIGYVRLPRPKQKFMRNLGSYSHGIALNWIYYNYIDKRKPRFFGTLDHDIYPTRPIILENKIQPQGYYGYKRGLNHKEWFLWPGMLFFRYDYVSKTKVNYMPSIHDGIYLDTGGALYKNFYSKIDLNAARIASFEKLTLKDLGYDNSAEVEFIDNREWFHSVNASHWKDNIIPYDDLIDEIIRKTENIKS
ncbi:MAG: hypothetical protein ACK5MK_03405 [Dysgonomonas sp.]